MCKQKVAIVLLCALFVVQQANAVINNGQSISSSENDANVKAENLNNDASNNGASDSVATASEPDANRRDAPVALSDTYGVPNLDSYVPLSSSNPGLPVPVYGVPDGPSNNIVFPAPPPDVPPPLPSHHSVGGGYGPPKPVYGPPPSFGGHSFGGPPFGGQSFGGSPFGGVSFGGPPFGGPHQKPLLGKPFFSHNGPPLKLPKPSYGPPVPSFPSKPIYGPPHKLHHGHPKIPKPFGPPLKLNHLPKPHFGPTKPIYGPPKIHGHHGHQKPLLGHPLPAPLFIPQKDLHASLGVHGSSNIVHGPPTPQYGPPEPIPHGPPHPGIPAPPTPPDIKYDGWQPIPGLVSHPPSDTYGVPHQGIATGADLNFNNDFVPPPVGGNIDSSLFLTYASAFAHGTPSDSYGAPLNSVTGSGGVVSSSIKDHGTSHIFDSSFVGDNLSHGHAFFSGGHVQGDSHLSAGLTDSYSAPPADSYALDGPYPAAKPHKGKGVFFGGSHGQHNHHGHHDHGFSSASIGLLPPSGIYGVPPGGKYGTPLLTPPKNIIIPGNTYGPPSPINLGPPKSPVLFREPVPSGLIESIGDSVQHKDAHGIEHSTTTFHGTAYIPPPIPDLTKNKESHGIPTPTNLYSLPNTASPVSFQTVSHGPSHGDHGSDVSHVFGSSFTSYTAPLGAIDSTYGAPPLQPAALTSSFDQSHQHLDLATNFGTLTNTYTVPISFHSNVPHDCSQHKSQPLPQITYGIPSAPASTYTTSLSSLNTNIGGQSNYQLPAVTYGTPDLQTAFSISSNNVQDGSLNLADIQGKALKDGDLQKSQEIHVANGVHNIPVQGSLGSYTLQIQSAGGYDHAGGADDVPHDQVLSEGLLQSILSAIEQPQSQGQNYYAQQPLEQNYAPLTSHLNHGYLDQSQSPSALIGVTNSPADGEAQHSVTREVVVTAPVTETTDAEPETTTALTTQDSSTGQTLDLIENNDIALYFSANGVEEDANQKKSVSTEAGKQEEGVDDQGVRNGQQYGSFVSFRTPHSSYVYGELKPQNNTQIVVGTS